MGLVKTNTVFQEHEFSVYRRYLCLENYPEPKIGKHHKKGEVIECRNESEVIGEDFLKTTFFKRLHWYENRTYEQLFSITHIQVSESVGYWIVGDILEVDGFSLDTDCKNPVFKGFKVGGHTVLSHNCLPLENYYVNQFKYRNKPRIANK